MAVFFQNISDNQFDTESDFLVKDSKTMNTVVGVLCLLFSLAAFAMSLVAGGVVLLLAVGAFTRANRNQTIIKINKHGFYYYGKLVTDWDHFIEQEFIDELPLGNSGHLSVNDRFFLLIKYYKEGQPGYFGRKIRLTNNQDKAEEEIIAAIRFYYKNCRNPVD